MNAGGELTLKDMILTLGERLGQIAYGSGSDNRATIPTDPNTLDRLTRAINNGRREVYSRMPEARCFQPRLSITMDPTGAGSQCVDGDPAKYALPRNAYGLAEGAWTWSLPESNGYGNDLVWSHPSDVARLHHTTSSGGLTSYPSHIALVTAAGTNPQEPGRRATTYLWVFPKPDKAYTLEGQTRIMWAPLTTLTDLEPMGQDHLETILAFAMRDWHYNRCEPDQWARIEATCDKAIAISLANDQARGPQSIGVGYDPNSAIESRRYANGRYYPEKAAMVDTVSGIPVL